MLLTCCHLLQVFVVAEHRYAATSEASGCSITRSQQGLGCDYRPLQPAAAHAAAGSVAVGCCCSCSCHLQTAVLLLIAKLSCCCLQRSMQPGHSCTCRKCRNPALANTAHSMRRAGAMVLDDVITSRASLLHAVCRVESVLHTLGAPTELPCLSPVCTCITVPGAVACTQFGLPVLSLETPPSPWQAAADWTMY